jgi:putative ABC transport system permease protein
MGFVLLVACSNIANLFLVRTESRARDTAVRMALGSSRLRLVRYIVTEGVLLGLLGGAVGVLLAWGGVRALVAAAPASVPRLSEIGLSGTVLAFTAGVSILSGLLFAVLPALRLASPAMLAILHVGGRSGSVGRERFGARGALVVSQVALALALFVGSALMVRSFTALYAVNPGYEPAGVATFTVAPSPTNYAGPAAVARFYDELLDDLRALPGVSAAGAITFLPLTGGLGADSDLFLAAQVEEFPPPPGGFPPTFLFRRVSPGYFEAMGIPVIEGRTFTTDDHERQLPVLLISRSIKDDYWPDQSALGKRITIAGVPAEVVGVVGDIHDAGLDAPAEQVAYKPIYDPSGRGVLGMTVAVRADRDPTSLAPEIRTVVSARDPDLPVANIRSMQSIVGASVSRTSFTMAVLGLAAGIALFIGGVGIYGVISYSVTQRTGEIGLRQALGADAGSVRRMVLREGLRMAVVGVAIGLVTAFGLGQVLSSLLYGIRPYDAVSLVAGAGALLTVAALASAIPAARAARISPADALRSD